MIHKYILLFSLAILTGQSQKINAQKKDLLKKVGLTEQQARRIAKQNGIIVDPGFDSNTSKPDISIDKKDIEKTQIEVIELLDAEKSNQKNKAKPILVESIVSEDFSDLYKKNEIQEQ